jgi:Leucine-rich repeat (LRR) protein
MGLFVVLYAHARQHVVRQVGESMQRNIGRCWTGLVAAAFASLGGIANAAIPATERAVLVDIYTSMHGEGWVDSTNWNGAAGTECTWFGITCDAAGEHVVGIALPTNKLEGPLPALDGLSELAVLDVHSNDCVFIEPPGVCHADPNANHLQGPPPSLAGLAHLQRLYAHAAGFSGPMPSLSGMTTLVTFDVSANLLNGPFPSLDGLDALEDFLVSDTTFVGSIPPLTAPNLRNFDVSGMQLDGSIPPLNQLARLETFKARYTTLTGSIPTLAGLANLQTFDVGLSLLDGTIGSLQGLTNLVTFDADYNRLTGSIPPLAGLTHLVTFDVHHNRLSGSIPALSGLSALRDFIVWCNQLSGSIPSLAGLTQLSTFDASVNQLSGSIPSLAGLSWLDNFSVYINELTGPIPPLAHQGIDSISRFVAFQNQLTGSMPSLEGLSNLAYFSVHDNRLTGTLPAFSGQSLDRLSQFEADRNQLTGSIPDLSTGVNLYILTLSSNALTGNIPPIPPGLYQFDASDNHLSGAIPDLSHADALQGFNVGFNDLSGAIPAPAAHMDQQPNIAGVSICPNHLTPSPSAAWDAIIGHSPWFDGCADSYVNPDQFGLTGAWYDTSDPGKGFLIDAMPDHVAPGIGTYFGGWFNFLCGIYGCPDGTPDSPEAQQQWFSFQDNVDATDSYVRQTVYESRGGNFDAPPTVGATPTGIFALAFEDCSHGMLRYHKANSVYQDRTVRLTRLTPSTTCTQDGTPVAAPASNTLLSGAWYDPTTAGQGLVFDINAENGVLFAAWYTFAVDGADLEALASQRWYTLQARIAADARTFDSVTIYDTTGGLFDAAWPPGEGGLQTTPVGSADIAFQSCSALTIDYRFTTGENGGHNGTLHLARLSPVPAGCAD